MSETNTRPGAAECPDCLLQESWFPGPQPHYDHVHIVETVPAPQDIDGHVIIHGYSVGMSGPELPQLWIFFEYLEPAIACGRAARMSADIKGYGVYRAAREQAIDWDAERKVVTLHLVGPSLDRTVGEADILRRWLEGVVPGSAYFEDRPPAFM
ncbi:hypothetical protein OG763_09775 [Streptomyces sp. NBC_01230]|uniref:hypothetical protein n=1 Tax=Streptomyces sp. NBC_01230 TaxID=2903784 RepID=UPI002E10E7E1|nr:hypothetical protein OG763_09775 [Streptomyces sp. NBC_01230]